MNAPNISFLADDIDWVQAPIVLWVLLVILTLLVSSMRFGVGGAREAMQKYRVFWVGSLVAAVIAMFVMHAQTGGTPGRWF